jgi:radical SAM superfamily enzyme YgiQ (UPF0313 family)
MEVTTMMVFLVHVRDPQFYALPSRTRAKNGRIRVMGFPPIGIMSLSAVLKRAGHECVIFDQANPETPNEVIIEEIKRKQPALVGLSFLSTTSYPYGKILARQIRAAGSKVKLAFGGVFASLNSPLVKLQCPEVDFVCRGDGEQLILDLLERLEDPSGVASVTWAKDGKVVNNPNRVMDRNLDQWPFPDRESLPLDFVESMPLDVPAGPVHDHADVARLPVVVRVLRYPDFQRGQVAFPESAARSGRVQVSPGTRVRLGLFCGRSFPAPAEADRGDLQRPLRPGQYDSMGL